LVILAAWRVVKEAMDLDIDLLLETQLPLTTGFRLLHIRIRMINLVSELFQKHV
jgi:hypothetical protein